MKRVLIVAHGHPDRSPGGGEIAARALQRVLQASDAFDAVLLARDDDPFPPHPGSAFSGTGEPAEIRFHTSLADSFLFSARNPSRTIRHFRDVLDTVRPDIVHFHHYLHLGLELLGEVRRYGPDIPIVLTLHDFQAICHNDGQMMTPGGVLCERSGAHECQRCFPGRNVQDFALRKRYLLACLEQVDRFVSPSEFLAQRYVQWGIARRRITVLENLLDPSTDRTIERVGDGVDDQRLRLAFFGRINGVKGVDLALQAMALLPRKKRDRVRLDLHGAGMERQPLLRKLQFRLAARRLGDCVRWRGAYRPRDVPTLMAENDWMLMPSRWWENSPVVILEARRHGLPVLCADIGGMAEKIEHGVTGLHFRAGDAHSLAARIEQLLEMGSERKRFVDAIAASSDQPTIAEQHLSLHKALL